MAYISDPKKHVLVHCPILVNIKINAILILDQNVRNYVKIN